MSILEVTAAFVGKKRAKYLLKSCSGREFIPALAHELQAEPRQILESFAQQLGVVFTENLKPFDLNLLQKSKFSLEELEENCACIQECESAPYALVTARPSAVDVEAFMRKGIPVMLSTEDAIFATIGKFGRKPTPSILALHKLINIAIEKGSTSLFLGVNGESNYCFHANGKRFAGKISNELLECALFEKDNLRNLVGEHLLIEEQPDGSITLCWAEQQDETGDMIFAENLFTVALVDDNPNYTKIVERLLRSKGWTVVTYNNGNEFLDRLKAKHLVPALVICDLHMPEIDGFNVLQQIKEVDSQIPVLMLTSDESDEAECQVASLQADALVHKQSSPETLISWCQNVINRSRGL